MTAQYEALNPWADVNAVSLRGLSPRLTDLTDQTIGLFVNFKKVADVIQTLVEARLKERYPSLRFSRFAFKENFEIAGGDDQSRFEDWVRGVDAVVSAVGD